jgi:hypothetical protein
MKVVMVIAVVIVFVVLLLAVLTTSKAYTYKHTIDPIDDTPNVDDGEEPKNIGTDN